MSHLIACDHLVPPPHAETIDSPVAQLLAPLLEEHEVLQALERLLSSPFFAKSYRMSRLLRFIVEKTVAGQGAYLKEYLIGVEVFDRKAPGYSPGDDPIVRVQMGRLREKLHQYYAQEADDTGIRFDIPLGSYAPHIQKMAEPVALPMPSAILLSRRELAILPLKSIGEHAVSQQFADGLREELLHQLFQEIGGQISLLLHCEPEEEDLVDQVLHTRPQPASRHVLEGSVRYDCDTVRVNVRLLNAQKSSLIWSAQFDQAVAGIFSAQESLASSICESLKPRVMALQ